jgi:hypothetical protein
VIYHFFAKIKGNLISKANCQAKDSSKKRMNEFVFTSKRRVFVRFLEESSARNKTFRDYLTFNPLNKNVALFVQLEKCFSFAKILFP